MPACSLVSSLLDGTDPGPKAFRNGAHRLIYPDATLSRMTAFMKRMGITRVADITGLDRIGIPVAMCIRPNARSLAVAQGKGVDRAAAHASALMESIESYHAECITLPLKLASYTELLCDHRVVEVDRLPSVLDTRFHPDLPILWIEGYDLLRRETVWVPYEIVHTNYTVPLVQGSGCFQATSNGLASGNHALEAINHGICEVVERDAWALWALRAAELAQFGMKGVGRIFSAYRDGSLTDDDEVAVIHGPAELGYPQLSESMANIRFTLQRAAETGVLGSRSRLALEDFAKSFFYPYRSYDTLLKHATDFGCTRSEVHALSGWLSKHRVDQKRDDALALLAEIREFVARDPAPMNVPYHLERTVFWERLVQNAGVQEDEPGGGTVTLPPDALLEELRLDTAAYVRASQAAFTRHLALTEALRNQHSADSGKVRDATDRFLCQHGLRQPEAIEQWLAENHITRERLEQLLSEEALLSEAWMRFGNSAAWRLIDELRLSGEDWRLLRRAFEKHSVLEARGLSDPRIENAGVSVEELVDWYFNRLPSPEGENFRFYLALEEFARKNARSFVRALLRELWYARILQEADSADEGRTGAV